MNTTDPDAVTRSVLGLRAACSRFPKVQPAARFTATKSPSLQDVLHHERVSPSPQSRKAGWTLESGSRLHAVQGLRHRFHILALAFT